jgi:hypothetical protein
MKQKIPYLAVLLVVGLLFMGVTLAQKPVPNIDPSKNPALSEAQHHIIEAYEKTEESQKHWKDKLGGHAEKALQHLSEASRELKEAAEYVDHHK